MISERMSKVIDYESELFKRSTGQVHRVAEQILEEWIENKAEPARVVDVVGSAMAAHVARGRGLKGDLRRVEANERAFLIDLAPDVDRLLRRIRRGGVNRKRVLECLGLIRACARATDLVCHHGFNREDAEELAGSEASAIIDFFENNVKEPFFAPRPPNRQT